MASASSTILGKRDSNALNEDNDDNDDNSSDDLEILSPQNKKRKLNDNECSSEFEDDINSSTANAKNRLLHLLRGVEQPIQVSVGGITGNVPNIPLLHVTKIGLVSLPLTDIQCKLLMEQMEPSSFGKHLSTEKDESIRKSYELAADKFEFKNNKFNQSIQKLTCSISESLGIDYKNVSALPYKLILYEKDSHFVEHRDTEKLENMFGTLIIQLPSIYTVYDNKPVLEVKHLKKEYKYYFGTDQNENGSATNIYYVANYCDLKHTVNKIESGYRLVVTYNLIWKGINNKNKPKIKVFNHLQNKINLIYKSWDDSETKPLCLNLEHLYTKRELNNNGIDALKGNDYSRINTLIESDIENNVRFCIANIKKNQSLYDTSGSYYHRRNKWYDDDDDINYDYCDWEINDSSTNIDNLWFIKNENMNELYDLIKDNLLKCIEEELEELDEDEEWTETNNVYEGYLGNEGATKDTTYKKCIIFAWKRESEFEMLINLGGIGAAIKYIQAMDQNQDDNQLKTAINLFNFKTDCKYITIIISMALKSMNMELISYFINTKLVSNNVSINIDFKDSNQSSCSYSYGNYYNNRNVNRYDNNTSNDSAKFMDILVRLIKEYGWKQPLKQSLLNLLSVVKENDIKHYILFIKKVKDFDLNIFKEISVNVWNNMVQKFNLNKDKNIGSNNNNLSKTNIILLFQYLSHCNFDESQHSKMFNIFSNYFLNLNNVEQEEIIYDKTMIELMVKTWNDAMCSFLVCVLSNCSDKINSTENYLFFPKLMKSKQINDESIQKIYNQIWNNIVIKLDLFETCLPFKNLLHSDIINIYQYILWCDFNKQQQINQFKMFLNAYTKYTEQDKQKKICNTINVKQSVFAKSLIELRIKYLTNKINAGAPTVRYRFPNLTNQNESQFERFLNGDQVKWKKYGWKSVIAARKWAQKYSGYSFTASAEGRGTSSYVLIEKNEYLQNYYNQRKVYNENIKELQLLQSQINSSP